MRACGWMQYSLTLGSELLLFRFGERGGPGLFFFSMWYARRLFWTASSSDMNVFFSSFSYSSSSRRASSAMRVSENSRIRTSSSMKISFSCARESCRSSVKRDIQCIAQSRVTKSSSGFRVGAVGRSPMARDKKYPTGSFFVCLICSLRAP